MKYAIIFITVLGVALSQPLTENENSQEDMKFFLYTDENGNTQIEDLVNQPLNLTSSASDVIYYFFSKSNPKKGIPIHSNKVTALLSTSFDIKKGTLFIIHGWKNSHESDVNSHIREYVLRDHDINVFVVDWSPIAGKNYISAKNSVELVGVYVANFIKSLKSSFGLNYKKLKFVGHSLGAHVSGCAGAALGGKVDRIVGLDPAGPLFKDHNKDNRIDADDAETVQIIHTNGGTLGYFAPCGDADYYPNGGKSQPGCGLDLTGTCSHSRAYALYAESLTCKDFVAQQCNSYSDYSKGRCDGYSSTMGMFNINKWAKGSYYLDTNKKSPYARG